MSETSFRTSIRARVDALLSPKSIAIVGASGDSGGLSSRPLEILQEHGYRGRLYVVNPNRDVVGGLATYKEVGAIADEVDLALICVPSRFVPGVLDDCGRKGIKTAYVLTSGFEGQDSQGSELARQLEEVLRRWPLRIAGPNGVGLYNLHDDIPITISGGADKGPGVTGNIAVVSQSGGLAFGIMEYGQLRHLGFSHVISTGNEVDLEAADYLEYFLDDPRTKVVCLFVEGFRSPDRLRRLLPQYLERRKALVIAKMGKSAEARQASVSHTAHVAGDNALYSALFERFGVYQAADVPEMLDAAAALSRWDSVGGRGVGILTASAGPAVWTVDACVASGLDVPELEPERQTSILEDLPYYAAARNPVDVTGGDLGVGFFKALRTMAASPRVNSLVLIGVEPHLNKPKFNASLREAVNDAGKPTFAYDQHPPSPEGQNAFGDLRLPFYTSPGGLARGVAALSQYSEAVARLDACAHTVRPPTSPQRFPEMSASAEVLNEYEIKRWLRGAGFPVPEGRLVHGVDEAVEVADVIGYPVAMKIQAAGIPHKADAGAVALNLTSEGQLRDAYQRILVAAQESLGGADFDGILVERMAPGGVEMMVGLKTDPDLGAFVVIGAGGVLTEVLDDLLIAPAPLTESDVAQLMRRLRCWPILEGSRAGHPARDVDAFCAVVSRLSLLAEDMVGVVGELDLNPIMVHSVGQGVEILDGLAVWASAGQPATLALSTAETQVNSMRQHVNDHHAAADLENRDPHEAAF
jgi:acetate---CoA ligase (ADP-forming)